MNTGRIRLLALALVVTSASVAASDEAVPDSAARAAAERFCQTIVRHGGFSYDEFQGRVRRVMRPLLSKRLFAVVDSIHACGRDWARHQPRNSTDKPPFVDCCVFVASDDWFPTHFTLLDSAPLANGGRRVVVEYRYVSAREDARWHVALHIVRENGRFVVDDFEGNVDEPDLQPWFVSAGDPYCRDGRWIAGY